MLKEQIKTITEFKEFILKEKGSEFIAKVYPIKSEQSALNELQNIRKIFFDATHHCFAYRTNDNITKYSDDGEPNGTAGIRILNAIDHFDLTDILLVVIRYFGGTKLGAGHLGKAYYNAAINVLETSQKIELCLFQLVTITTEFAHINHIHRLMNNYSAIIVKSDFNDNAVFNCLIKTSLVNKITFELTNLTNGQIVIKLKNEYKYK